MPETPPPTIAMSRTPDRPACPDELRLRQDALTARAPCPRRTSGAARPSGRRRCARRAPRSCRPRGPPAASPPCPPATSCGATACNGLSSSSISAFLGPYDGKRIADWGRRGAEIGCARARAPRHHRLPRGASSRASSGSRSSGSGSQPVPPAHGRPAARTRVEGKRVIGLRAPGQADRLRARGRPLPRLAPDDRRAAALEAARREAPGQDRARGLRLRRRHAAADRGQHEEARLAARRARRGRLCAAIDPGGLEVFDATLAAFARGARLARTTRSSARSPTRASSAASATPTPTRSCTAPRSRR